MVIRGFCYDDGNGNFDLSVKPGTGIDDYVRPFEVLIQLRRNRRGKDTVELVYINAPAVETTYWQVKDYDE
jgi:hypothetical protein